MADQEQPQAWGLWNATLREWFNPGTTRPYFQSRNDAERVMPLARRQWALGTWVVAPYPLVDGNPDTLPNSPLLA
jgi:hypothetical protein